MKDELSEEVARRHAVFDHAREATLLADDDGRYIDANPAAVALTGYSREDLLTMRLTDLAWPGRPTEDVERQYQGFLAKGHEDGTFVLLRRDGTTREVEYRAVVDVLPGVHLAIMRDVTERNAMTRKLGRSEADFRELAEQATDIVARLLVLADGTLEVKYVNPAAARVLGYPLDRFYADPQLLRDIVGPSARTAVAGQLPSSEERRTTVMVRARRQDGTRVWLEVNVTLSDEPTGLSMFLVVARDITERNEAQQALLAAVRREREAAEKLGAINVVKDTLLRNVSHELRTPLTSILGFAATLVEHGDRLRPAQTAHFQQRLLHHAKRLQRSLDDLIDIDRMSRRHTGMIRTPTELGTLLRDVVARTPLQMHEVILDLEEVTIEADAERIERIVENLLDNVLRHTPHGTRLWIELTATAGGARLAFDDDGPGLPEGVRDRLFEPFEQGPDSAASPDPGAGLGLALVACVAASHGGGAIAEDSPRGGARIIVTLAG